MIGVVATLEIQDGKQAEFEATAKELMAKVNANEPGCTMYQLFKSKKSATTYTFMEQYSSQEALDAHGKTEYFTAAMPAMGAVMAGAPDIQVFDIVS